MPSWPDRSADGGFAILPSTPLTNSNLNRRSVNAGVIQIEVSHARLMLERARSTVLGLVLADLLLCLLYTSPSPRDLSTSRMPSSA